MLSDLQPTGPLQVVSSTDWEGWMVLLCLAFTDGDSVECLERTSFTKLHSGQKVRYSTSNVTHRD